MKWSDEAKRMVRSILTIALVFAAACALYYRSFLCLPFLFGLLLGCAVSVFKVALLERTVEKALQMEQKTAGNYVGIHQLLRLLLSGVVLVLGAVVPHISLWGVVAGIFSFQLAVYDVNIKQNRSA